MNHILETGKNSVPLTSFSPAYLLVVSSYHPLPVNLADHTAQET